MNLSLHNHLDLIELLFVMSIIILILGLLIECAAHVSYDRFLQRIAEIIIVVTVILIVLFGLVGLYLSFVTRAL